MDLEDQLTRIVEMKEFGKYGDENRSSLDVGRTCSEQNILWGAREFMWQGQQNYRY
jgi:hypothetical protein